MESGAAGDVPQWRVVGDWFDVCRCDIPCPCEFAQAPTDNWCQGVLAWHIREGYYGDVQLDGLSLIAVGEFEGNIWGEETKAVMGMFIDERADESQREALQMIFGGQAGGFPAEFAELIGENLGVEVAPIEYEDDGRRHRVRIGEFAEIEIEDFVPPQIPEGEVSKLTGIFHPANSTLTIAQATTSRVNAFGLEFSHEGKNGLSAPFSWAA